MADSKFVTVMLVPEGAEARFGFRMRYWLLKSIVVSIAVILIGIVLFFGFYGTVLTRAAMTGQLQKENESLRRYSYKVSLLEQNLKDARNVVSRLARMAGIDYQFPEFPNDSTLFARLDYGGDATISRTTIQDWTVPEGLPTEGFITQEFSITEGEQYHSGVDIACAIGTSVLATGSGIVEYVGFDSVYGYMLVIRHNDSVTSIYGHNDQLLVRVGQDVPVGSRVALSGNTGKSSAPHLHYEVRINEKPIDPLEMMYEENK